MQKYQIFEHIYQHPRKPKHKSNIAQIKKIA